MTRSKKATLKRKSAGTKKNRAATARKPHASNQSTSAGKSRAEGIRLFTLAGRPSGEDFVRVYGPAGPKMTGSNEPKQACQPRSSRQHSLRRCGRRSKGLPLCHFVLGART
jgi:hypothetical protein